jgi:hypothetical protein
MRTIDLTNTNTKTNFLETGKDTEIIVGKIANNQDLLKLLYYNDSDALEKDDITDADLIKKIFKDNIRRKPLVEVPEELNSFMIITFDSFTPSENPEFRDNLISFDVLCPMEAWDNLGDYLTRPLLILHHLSAMFHNQKLAGIGKAKFFSADILNIGPYAGYQIVFSVTNAD